MFQLKIPFNMYRGDNNILRDILKGPRYNLWCRNTDLRHYNIDSRLVPKSQTCSDRDQYQGQNYERCFLDVHKSHRVS